MRDINKIIVHCSATKDGQHYDIDDIRSWHVNGNGWSDVGYHFVVLLDGRIQIGRPLEKMGSHCKGQNKTSIGVCYIGGLDSSGKYRDTRTYEQRESLEVLIATLVRMFPDSDVFGHNNFSSKACPCFDAHEEYKYLV
jgi:N-acetylmuramoyl-L-alanine amidase